MTTTKWRAIEPRAIALADLVLQQDTVDIAALLGHKPTLHDEFPHVVIWQGEHYLSDGHHRVVAAVLRGQGHIMARVLEI